MAQWRKVVVSGSNAVLNEVTASGAIVPKTDDSVDLGSSALEFKDLYIDGTAELDTANISAGTITGITDLAVADGGTGASTLTQNGVLIGNGTGAVSAVDLSTDGAIVVGDGSGNPTSLDIGGSGGITILGTIATGVWEGTTVAVDQGGTGATSLSNLITLGTHSTGNYISTITPGSGVLLDGASSATSTETATPTLSVDSGSMSAYYSSSAFSVISGDVAITSAGVATVTGATTNAALTAGAGISAGGTFDGATARTFALDINELDAEAIASGDTIAFNDAGDDGQHKESIDDIATLFAGTGLTATSAVIAIDAADTTTTSIINSSLAKIGTSATEEYITFGSANEVNTFVNNTERHSVTATGVDITGNLTVSANTTIAGNLDVNGTLTTIDTTNTYVADKFMIVASGSQSDTDGGIIVQNTVGAGYALGYDSGVDRWAFDADLAHNATALGPDAYVGVVQVATTDGDSFAAPIYGGATNGVGTIYVDTDDSEIWIYA